MQIEITKVELDGLVARNQEAQASESRLVMSREAVEFYVSKLVEKYNKGGVVKGIDINKGVIEFEDKEEKKK